MCGGGAALWGMQAEEALTSAVQKSKPENVPTPRLCPHILKSATVFYAHEWKFFTSKTIKLEEYLIAMVQRR
jgi:hypothetical protein